VNEYPAARLAGEEAIGAELLAGRELLALAGVLWSTAEGMTRLLADQGRFLVDDHRRHAEAWLSAPEPARAAEHVSDHVKRRLTHLAEGADQLNRLMFTQTREACRVLQAFWRPYLAVVREDWRSARGGASRLLE
jgi:hypothetical protein